MSVIPLPEIAGSIGELLVRQWRPEDAEALAEAVSASVEHLRPWMEWISSDPPMSVGARRERIRQWQERAREGHDAIYGMFVGDVAVGSCGLHYRLPRGGIEIGYWVRAGYTGRGFATAASALLTDAAFAVPSISFVEIHHDKANAASAAVPRKLGFTLIGEAADVPEAPSEIGIECRWRMTREQWAVERPDVSVRESDASVRDDI